MMVLRILFETLKSRFGSKADPDQWWPIFHGETVPREFERAITNTLVHNSNWRSIETAIAELHDAGLLTTAALSQASPDKVACCIRCTGLQVQKATRLISFAHFVQDRFGSESAFCQEVTREQLLALPGIGAETADRTLLYACGRLAWPVDTYCLRVLAHHQIIKEIPTASAAKRRASETIKATVARKIAQTLEDW